MLTREITVPNVQAYSAACEQLALVVGWEKAAGLV